MFKPFPLDQPNCNLNLVLTQIQQDLIDCERRVSLEKAIVKERREFEDLTKYPYHKGNLILNLIIYALHELLWYYEINICHDVSHFLFLLPTVRPE